ncbi:hypothetical protein PLICRDRAFT_645172 [Plicaturopsis crispa FD-325 SS-3]|nr:hypothetical protein PLICRDRAFT_645172 [Plicaturopsis crispa FD-325 SS-3]
MRHGILCGVSSRGRGVSRLEQAFLSAEIAEIDLRMITWASRNKRVHGPRQSRRNMSIQDRVNELCRSTVLHFQEFSVFRSSPFFRSRDSQRKNEGAGGSTTTEVGSIAGCQDGHREKRSRSQAKERMIRSEFTAECLDVYSRSNVRVPASIRLELSSSGILRRTAKPESLGIAGSDIDECSKQERSRGESLVNE